ncbi:MAG: protein kinase [Oscillatoria sp. SIO1A7]|nr:protein kinase [Oscillatoria sp. SIO1A7]
MSLCINPHCPNPNNPDRLMFCFACGSELLLVGRYKVIKKRKSGGFSDIYEIKQDNDIKLLKILRLDKIPERARPKVLSLFQQEAKVLMDLNHPGIPRGDRYFEFLPKNSQTPLHCLVMEKIDGADLQEYMTKRGRSIDQDLAIEWLLQLTAILDLVHAENFFHRDIKPANIMLRPDGKLALIDFGTVREVTGTYYVKQEEGQVTGFVSAGYTPPEQLNGHALLQSDFFALGRTFVYLLSGKKPNHPDLYDPNRDELRWRDYAPGISPVLADFIERLMARTPNQRPASTGVILERLIEIKNELKNEVQDQRKNELKNDRYSPELRIPPPPPPQYQLAARGFKPKSIPPPAPISPPSISSRPITAIVDIESPPTAPPTIHCGLTAENPWQNVRLEYVLPGHSEPINCLAISADGQTLASASNDSTIRLWNLDTGKEISTLGPLFSSLLNSVTSVAMSPDGQTLASSSDDSTIAIWNLRSSDWKKTALTAHSNGVNSVAIDREGKILASASEDRTIKLWNLASTEVIHTLTGHSDWVLCVAISPDGQTLASGSSDNTARLWNLNTGELLHTLWGHSSGVRCITFSPDGRTVASGSEDKTIKLWDVTSGEEIRTLKGNSDWVLSLSFSPDGKTLANGAWDENIKFWNPKTGEEVHSLRGHSIRVSSVAFAADGKTIATAGWDCSIKIWRRAC